MRDLNTKWLPVAAVVATLWAGGMTNAQAAVCEATNSITNPDAKVTNSVACGSGTTDESYNALDVRNVENVLGYNLDWNLLEEVSVEGQTNGTSLTFTGTKSGDWYLSTNLALDVNSFLLVIKDGGVTTGEPPNTTEAPKWYWFILDETSMSPITCGTDVDLCGTWSMYGSNGTLKDISHMRIYYAEGGGGEEEEVPEPGSLVLLGAGLLGIWATRRRITRF